MKKTFLFLFFLANFHFLFAQYGITGGFTKMNVPTWQIPVDTYITGTKSYFLKNGVYFEIDRKFGLKNIRIDFYPGVKYNSQTFIIEDSKFKWTLAGFQVTAKFYTFDLNGNCNCPTFGHGGETFKKGFHFTLSPGVDYLFLIHQANSTENHTIDINQEKIIFSISGGAGLDIGLSELLTLTPVVNLRYFPPVEWKGLTKEVSQGAETGKYDSNQIFQLFGGVRIGLNFGR